MEFFQIIGVLKVGGFEIWRRFKLIQLEVLYRGPQTKVQM